MHKWAKQIMECVKAKVDGIGIDNFEGQNLDDLKDFTEIAKNIACFDKDYRIVEVMEKSEDNEDIMRMLEQYEDYPDRRFYDDYRYMRTGRYAPKGKGTYVGRRGYEEPPYYHMNPDMYREHTPEYYRDVDRENGRLYFSEPITMESRYDKAKRMYTETKEKHNSGSVEDKQLTLKEGEKMLNVIIDELMEMVSDATPEMKNMIKTKGMSAMQKIQ